MVACKSLRNRQSKRLLLRAYKVLYQAYGPRRWWPADSALEVIVGAILTQNTSWPNVEKAIVNLKKKGVLSAKALHSITLKRLAVYIRPCGYYNIKAKRLKNFIDFFLLNYSGNISLMKERRRGTLRKELLCIKGIGPETADSILLYALAMPSFVVDSYAIRVLSRLGVGAGRGYDSMKKSFEDALSNDVAKLAKAHALVVIHCKTRCKRSPDCNGCPLSAYCLFGSEEKE